MQKDKRINQEIRASKVSVINADWEKMWVMLKDEAILLAEEAWMDLVEVWFQDWVVLTKMMDYWKFLFKQQKNISKSRVVSKKTLKTVKLTYKIEEHDMEVKKNQAIKFSKEWHSLKVILFLRWRERQYEAIALSKMESFVSSLEEYYKPENRIVKIGDSFNVILHPKK